MPFSGAAWVPQTIAETPPALWGAEQVAGEWWLIYLSGPDLVRVQADGTMSRVNVPDGFYPFGRSVTHVGDVLLGVDGSSTGVWCYTYDISSGVSTSVFVTTPGASGVEYGSGAVGNDGKVYFPALKADSGQASLLPLVYDPVAGTWALTNFTGTWITYGYGLAVAGGDGLVYFLPGQLTPGGGIYFSGTKVAVVDAAAGTVVSMDPPLRYGSSTPEDTFYWAAPAPGGVYAGSNRDFIHKITPSGSLFVGTGDTGSGGYANGAELTAQAKFEGGAAVGPDGLVYAVGYQYRSSGNYTPAVLWIDPSDDSLHFQEFPTMTGRPFTPVHTFTVGDTVRAFSYEWDFADLFVATLAAPPSPAPPVSVGAVGAVGLSVGAVTVDISLG